LFLGAWGYVVPVSVLPASAIWPVCPKTMPVSRDGGLHRPCFSALSVCRLTSRFVSNSGTGRSRPAGRKGLVVGSSRFIMGDFNPRALFSIWGRMMDGPAISRAIPPTSMAVAWKRNEAPLLMLIPTDRAGAHVHPGDGGLPWQCLPEVLIFLRTRRACHGWPGSGAMS